MALDKDALSDLLDALCAGGDLDVVRTGMQLVLQALIDLEAAQAIGAGRYERSPERVTHRNGARERLLSTKAGDQELQIWSTNPLERVNGEIKRRADVAGIFPNEAAILRLVGAVLMETHDEWQITERRYFSEGSMATIHAASSPPAATEDRPALLASQTTP